VSAWVALHGSPTWLWANTGVHLVFAFLFGALTGRGRPEVADPTC
jgi:hypothetical protein